MRNINRMNDYFVRYLLGSIGNEDILENIVNCVLIDSENIVNCVLIDSGFEEVHNLEIINPHNLPENINLKESVLDVKAKTKDNKKIIIEIQLSGNIDFVKRIYYYISKNIVSELNENESYDIISQVISINFVNFNMDFNDEGKAHRCFKLIDTQNHNVSLDIIQMHIIEIPRFIKILNNANTDDIKKNKILSWIEFFTVKDLDKVKEKLKELNNIMSKVIDKYERFISSEEEMEVYNARDAFLYGQTIMLKREREEGIKEGIEKEKYSLVRNMKKKNMDINLISELTGLSIEEIKNL